MHGDSACAWYVGLLQVRQVFSANKKENVYTQLTLRRTEWRNRPRQRICPCKKRRENNKICICFSPFLALSPSSVPSLFSILPLLGLLFYLIVVLGGKGHRPLAPRPLWIRHWLMPLKMVVYALFSDNVQLEARLAAEYGVPFNKELICTAFLTLDVKYQCFQSESHVICTYSQPSRTREIRGRNALIAQYVAIEPQSNRLPQRYHMYISLLLLTFIATVIRVARWRHNRSRTWSVCFYSRSSGLCAVCCRVDTRTNWPPSIITTIAI